ncbi:MAG: rod shape-determining protein RodA [Bacteroidetes bacterium]|nr:rod shape-determining protein RodA [Bacteroidota bacterium]MCH8523690.1 rod shape-determining protein RodA [Balneolales bacterium]
MNIAWYKDFDWLTVLIWVAITAFGLVGIYSATLGPVSEFLPAHIQENFAKQLTWVALSLVVVIVIQFTSPRSFQQLSYLFYFVALLLTASTIFIGIEVNGAKSWLDFGGIRFQTSEIMKIAVILAVANYLTSRRNIEAVNLKSAMVATSMILLPVVIIILQNDTGSALIFLPLIPVMLFLSGLPYGIALMMISPAIITYASIISWQYGVAATLFFTLVIYLLQKRPWLGITSLVTGLLLVVAVNVALTDILQPHQRNRIEAFVNPFQDPQGAGWNIIQAKTAISSGGIYGKGFMQGTQTQLRFLPEQWTDFIFCVIAEDFGLIGGGLAILALLLLLMRLLSNAVAMKTPFAQLVIVGVVTILFTHILVNLGSVMGIVPVIGVPLPFMSYGGSSFLANSIMLGVCLNLYFRQREMSPFA